MTFGKTWGLRRMADAAGHCKMVAVDQRPPIVALIAAKRGIDADAVTFADIVAVRRLLARALAPHASAHAARWVPDLRAVDALAREVAFARARM